MNLPVVCDYLLVAFLLSILAGESDAQGECDVGMGYHQVTIPLGTLQGITTTSRKGRNVASFMGIRYAKPPIGNLRFSNPVPVDPWFGIRNATVIGSPCPQLSGSINEDCLYLNVFTPQMTVSQNCPPLAVMVFIHGGGFETGSGSPPPYDSNYLADGNVILVTLNYRLGPFGFLSTGDGVASGNWGCKDQVLALKWVKQYIAYFGGDPERVTIFGESAGGMSVELLAMSDSTIGLFNQYISQSGPGLSTWVYRNKSASANIARKIGLALGCVPVTSFLLITCLRLQSVAAILNTRAMFYVWQNYPIVLWGPTDEGNTTDAFLTDDPEKLVAAGKLRNATSERGFAESDGLAFVPGMSPNSLIFQEFLYHFQTLLLIALQTEYRIKNESRFIAAVMEFYFNNDLTTNRTAVWLKCGELFTDFLFIYPYYKVLQQQVASGQQPFRFYSFGYRGTFSLGDLLDHDAMKDSVIHADDLIYLFPVTDYIFPLETDRLTDADHLMMDIMTQLWTSFATDGTPRTAPEISNITWEPYGSNRNYLRIGNGSATTLELKNNNLQERMQFWDDLTSE